MGKWTEKRSELSIYRHESPHVGGQFRPAQLIGFGPIETSVSPAKTGEFHILVEL